MGTILTEITPLTERDFFYLAYRKKELFNYPIHKHHELELNFIENCEGATRTVGDSVETLGKYDLALIGSDLEHVWENGTCQSHDLHEITIQFMPEMLEGVMGKNIFDSIRHMMKRAGQGIAFELPAIMQVYALLTDLANMETGFDRMLCFLRILYRLSLSDNYHLLSSTSFAAIHDSSDSRRILKVKDFITKNYKKEIRLQQLSDLAGMTPTAFSRFFRKHTSCSVSDYIIFTRLGFAARMLVDSTMSVVEICYACGFNNVSNFNRIFKKRKGCTPKEFREEYLKKKILV